MQLIPSRRTQIPLAVIILCAAILAAAALLVTWQVGQHQTTTQRQAAAPPAACGSAWTHSLGGQTQLLMADRGALTCFAAAARACRPASLHVTEMGVDTGTEHEFTVEGTQAGGTTCRVTEQSQFYSANGGGSQGPVITTSCQRAAVTSAGVTLSCAGQPVLIPAKVTKVSVP